MNILIVFCHPSRKSYTFQVLLQLEIELRSNNWNVEISDLYAMNFQSDMTEVEYEGQGFTIAGSAISNDIELERKKIEKADCVIFLYPVWWSDCPAKLKGWFDRVYSIGYAKQQNEKPRRYGIVISTAGHPNELLTETGISQSMQTIMLDDRLGKRFENKDMLILGGTLEIELVRELHKSKIKELSAKIASHGA